MAEPKSEVTKYLDVIASYDNEFKKWQARVEKILKRYRDDNRSQSGNESAKYNVLWSNVQTLIPAVYARTPKADVSRRFVDNDPVGRVASLLIERCLDFEIEHYGDFRSSLYMCVEDRFLGGRGVAWVRYDPHVSKQDTQVTEDVPSPDQGDQEPETGGPGQSLGTGAEGPLDQTEGQDAPPEKVDYECTPVDYVYWKDFGHSSARTWEEVTQVWRWVYMTKEALEARFGKEKAAKVPLDNGPEAWGQQKRGEKITNDRGKICELWDEETGKAVWFAKGAQEFLDERDDPLELENFWPCPKPLYATLTTDTLVPVPDFALYQDQATELDILSDRIDGLVKALRVRGIYDASQPMLQRLLTEGDNNTLVGTDHWAAFSEKGGLKGSIDLLPINDFASALQQCYQARQDIKSQVFEITGISDIVRGQGAASETATAQQIKGQYVGLRLRSMQETVALFASELLRIKAQIICSKYQDNTILNYAAARQLSPTDQQLIGPALQLIRQTPLNTFRIQVAADSLVQIDEQQTKQERLEFLNTLSNFLREAVPAGQQVPEMVPAIMGMIQFGIAGFKQAASLEGVLDTALQQLEQKAAQNAANPKPTKEQQEAQADMQKAQMQAQADGQVEQMKMQGEQQIEQMKMQFQMQMTQMEQQHATQLAQMKLQQEQAYSKWEAELKASTQVQVALIAAGQNTGGPIMEASNAAAENLAHVFGQGVAALMQHVTGALADAQNGLAQTHAQHMQQINGALAAAAAPKRIIRGPDGRAVGVEPMLPAPQQAAAPPIVQ